MDTPQVFSITQLNQYVAYTLADTIGKMVLTVRGEIADFTRASSGHCYFQLKDDDSRVRAVMFKYTAASLDFVPKNGDAVEVEAKVTLFAARGEYQINVQAMRRAGIGRLYERFLELKTQLEQEGVFAQAKDKVIPVYCRKVGVVTSLQADALRDVCTVLKRRSPQVDIVIYPSEYVQGKQAPEALQKAIQNAITDAQVDVLLVVRGGGSYEDLFAFNHPDLVRLIARSPIPVVTGIGHETDFTLSDYAATIRAATPSVAAETVTRPTQQWLQQVANYHQQMSHLVKQLYARCEQCWQQLDRQMHTQLSDRYAQCSIRYDQVHLTLTHYAPDHQLALKYQRFHHLNEWLQTFRLPAQYHKQWLHAHTLLQQRMTCAPQWRQLHQLQADWKHCDRWLGQASSQLQGLSTALKHLNPQSVLQRGYSILTDCHGHVLQSVQVLAQQTQIQAQMADGRVQMVIEQPQIIEDLDHV